MTRIARESVLPYPPEFVRAWHDRPGALERLSPPWQEIRVHLREGPRVHLSLNVGPTRRKWIAVQREEPDGFSDTQEVGPFKRWVHHHRFLHGPNGDTRMIDEVEYELDLPESLAPGYVSAEIERAFAYRHQQLAADLARHAAAPPRPMRIAVTGATGLIGSRLVPFLTTGGHDVRMLKVRDAVDPKSLEGMDAVVHLAGESINQRWTRAAKERIFASRTRTTRSLAQAMADARDGPKVLVCASAIGLYGERGDETLSESAAPGDGFLAGVVQAWEAACDPARAAGIRVVHTRFGLVLAEEGGALHALLTPFRFGAGGPVGPSTQWWSWVHIDDVVGAIHRALYDGSIEGPVNVVAPAAVRNKEFVKTLGRAMHRPAVAPLPTFAVKTMFGEMGGLLLESQHVVPEKLEAAGFTFTHPSLEEALGFELGSQFKP